MKKPEKIRKVLREFKEGDLKSSSGQKVTNRKQAVAIALSEASRMRGRAGKASEPKAMGCGKECRQGQVRCVPLCLCECLGIKGVQEEGWHLAWT